MHSIIHRNAALREIGESLYEFVETAFTEGATLHDRHLQEEALDINERTVKLKGFKASLSWIKKWKKAHRVCSRHITKFISRIMYKNKEQVYASGERFVQDVKVIS